MKPFNVRLAILLAILLGLLLGSLTFAEWTKSTAAIEPVIWSPAAEWITTPQPSYRLYARRNFDVPDGVQVAWLRLSADNDFLLYVNGNVVAKEVSITNNTLGLGRRLSSLAQVLSTDAFPYRIASSAEVLLSNTPDWKNTVYVDLTPYLTPGRNVIALEVQKSRQNPRVVVEGAVYPISGASSIDLTTGATTWKATTLSETHQMLQWFDPGFPDQNWSDAPTLAPVRETTYSRLRPSLFQKPLFGNWITGTPTVQGEIWLRSNWHLSEDYQRGYVRFSGRASNDYALLINDRLIHRYSNEIRNTLHLYDVTALLHPGDNTLAVRLATALTSDGISGKNATPSFYLDGWVETATGQETGTIATDGTWQTLSTPIMDWQHSAAPSQAARTLALPDPQAFYRTFEGDADRFNYPAFLHHRLLWQTTGIGLMLLIASGLGYVWHYPQSNWRRYLTTGVGLLLPGTLFLIGVGLFKHRFAETARGLLFVHPHSFAVIGLAFISIEILVLVAGWSYRNRHEDGSLWLPQWQWVGLGLFASSGFAIAGIPFLICLIGIALGLTALWFWQHHHPDATIDWTSSITLFRSDRESDRGSAILLLLIIGLGFFLRVYKLNFIDLGFDENVSLDAINGILRTGAPESASGIWYTRSPFYHYMTAIWLALVGYSIHNARLLSAIWGTATLLLVFMMSRQLTGKVWIALLITGLLAIDPWAIMISRIIRFYQIVQFLGLLSFWLFLKGFVEQKGKKYQHGFFIAITLMILNQEVTVTLLPCFLLGFLCFYRPFSLSKDWSIVVGALMTVGITIYDITFFGIKCLTPWVALSTTTDSIIKPHLWYLNGFFTSFFAGYNRMNTIYSFFFIVGFFYFLKRRNSVLTFLFSSVFLSLILLTVLVMQIANRYAYTIYPLFLILAIYSAIVVVEHLSRNLQIDLLQNFPLRGIAVSLTVLLLVSNVEFDRVLSGYNDAIYKRNMQVLEYVSQQRQTGDIVISSSPSAIATTLGRLDYYVPGSMSYFDTVYWSDGRVVERWAGGQLMTNIDQLNQVLNQAKRVWIHVDDTTEQRVDPQMISVLQTLGQPVLESFGAHLRLWRADSGQLPRLPNQNRDLGSY